MSSVPQTKVASRIGLQIGRPLMLASSLFIGSIS
jgi:hypothetical protein